MRIKLKCLPVMLAALLAACSSGAGSGTATVAPTLPSVIVATDEGSALVQVPSKTSESVSVDATGEPYPPLTAAPVEGAYPPMPTQSAPPTAYPGATGSAVIGLPLTPSPQQSWLIEASARDLNLQTDVPVDEIELMAAMSVVWPDGGLGCPEAGMSYTQAQVEGLLITLGAGGKEFTYHTDGTNNFVLCRDGKRISSGAIP